MKRAIAACLALLALMATHCVAAEPAAEPKAVPKEKPSPKPTADAPQPVIPERKLTFDVSEEEERLPLSQRYPELTEQRYLATFSLVGGPRLEVLTFGPIAREGVDGYRVAVGRYQSVLFGAPPRMRIDSELKSALREMPQERVPSEEVLSLLTVLMTKGSPYFRQSVAPADPEATDDKDIRIMHFTILAPSAERAKEVVQAVVYFYDYGVFYPLQKGALAVKAACQKRLEEDRAGLKEAKIELDAVRRQLEGLKEFQDITPDSLLEFTTQQRLISVDMRGVKARIEACNKILAGATEKSLRPGRLEQLETLKITAEIELVGLAARKEALEEIVQKGQERKELSAKFVQVQSRVTSLESEIRSMSEGIRHYDTELNKCIPYPVKDGKVVIRPIKWVSGAYTPSRGQ